MGMGRFTVPDFLFAVRDPRVALEAGLDLPALGSDSQLTREDLLQHESLLDSIALHVLTAVEYVGLKPMKEASSQPPPESASVAKAIAIEGMVLLKNDASLLPLPASTRVAVVDAVNVRAVLVVGRGFGLPHRRADRVDPGSARQGAGFTRSGTGSAGR
jgi:beta-glucosidase